MAARQTEACERGQVPALQKADQVAAAGMQGGMGAPFRLVTHWIKAGRMDFCRFMSRTMPSWAPAPASITLCAPSSKPQHLEPRTFAGRQLLPCNCTPRTCAARCPKPARSRCQALVLQKGCTNTGRKREPAARAQPCTAITVLLIPRGFRMSEPSVLRQGQLGQGRAAILPTWWMWMCPSTCCFSLPRGKRCFCCARLCAKGNGQIPQTASHPFLLPDYRLGTGMSLPGPGEEGALCSSLPYGQCDQLCQAGRQELEGQQAGQIYRSPYPAAMAMLPSSAATEITHLIRRCQTCSSHKCH